MDENKMFYKNILKKGKILNRSGIYFLLFWEVVIQEGKLSRGGNRESHHCLSQ